MEALNLQFLVKDSSWSEACMAASSKVYVLKLGRSIEKYCYHTDIMIRTLRRQELSLVRWRGFIPPLFSEKDTGYAM